MASQTLIGSHKITVMTSQAQFGSHKAVIRSNQTMLMASQTLIGSHQVLVVSGPTKKHLWHLRLCSGFQDNSHDIPHSVWDSTGSDQEHQEMLLASQTQIGSHKIRAMTTYTRLSSHLHHQDFKLGAMLSSCLFHQEVKLDTILSCCPCHQDI